MDFSFLKSNRFWALVGLAVVGVLQGLDLIEANVAQNLQIFFAGFITVRTVDKAFEKK